jgi:hypothetical protein
MVDVSGCVAQIRAMVDRGDYLCVNRARHYGKTTTLTALERALTDEYDVASLDFQALGHADFRTEGHFVRALSRIITHMMLLPPRTTMEMGALAKGDVGNLSLGDLFFAFSTWCSESSRPVVLIVDEVDSATNNHVFLDFLAQLRLQYLQREKRPDFPAFKSVILAGVTDVRHLKMKTRPGESTARGTSRLTSTST